MKHDSDIERATLQADRVLKIGLWLGAILFLMICLIAGVYIAKDQNLPHAPVEMIEK